MQKTIVIKARSRLYYFDSAKDSKGQPYVTITEVNTRTRKKARLYLHPEYFGQFAAALAAATDQTSENVKE